MTTTTITPDGFLANGDNGTIFGGSPTEHAAVADASDATYVRFSGNYSQHTLSSFTVGTDAVKSVDLQIRARYDSGGSTSQLRSYVKINETTYAGVYENFIADTFVDYSSGAQPVGDVAEQAEVDRLYVRLGLAAVDIARVAVVVTHVPQPVVAVDAVTDPYTASTSVAASWVNTLDSDGGLQTRYEAKVFSAAQYGAGGFTPFSTNHVYYSGNVLSGDTSATVGPIPNTATYRLYVRTAQTINGRAHWSDWDFDQFTMDVSTSDVSTVVAVPVDADGKIGVTVTRDGASEAWELVDVERSTDAGTTWSAVRGATLVDSTGDATTFDVDDHEAPNGGDVLYRARATYYSSGLSIVGDWTESASAGWSSDDEWLKVPGSPALNTKIEGVAFDPQARTPSAGVFNPVGRRDLVVVSDVMSAATGGLAIRAQGRAEMLAVDALLELSPVLLLNLKPDSLIGPNRDGFMYVAPTSDSETWETEYYRGNNTDRRFRSIGFAEVGAPPDPSAGVV